jgi:hypothetical protein
MPSIVCVVGDSRVTVRNSRFSWNIFTPLAVRQRAEVVLHASNISHNGVEGHAGGIYVDGRARVWIGGGSRVNGNSAKVWWGAVC